MSTPIERARAMAPRGRPAGPDTATPAPIPHRPSWLSRYRTVSDVGGADEQYTRLSDLVGQVLVISALESGTSRENGPFVRAFVQPLDMQTGELAGEPSLVISFAQVPNRIFNRIAGGRIEGRLDLNPGFVCRVAEDHGVLLLVDP